MIKLGWCNLSFRESQAVREAHDFYNHGIKPVYCITSDSYYRSVVDACNTLTAKTGVNHSQGTLRQYIKESKLYKGKAYIYGATGMQSSGCCICKRIVLWDFDHKTAYKASAKKFVS